jgi:hypothetical protein
MSAIYTIFFAICAANHYRAQIFAQQPPIIFGSMEPMIGSIGTHG